MTSMTSGEGETVQFSESLYPTGNVEDWLSEVERVMVQSVRQECHKSVLDYVERKRTEWVLAWPGLFVSSNFFSIYNNYNNI